MSLICYGLHTEHPLLTLPIACPRCKGPMTLRQAGLDADESCCVLHADDVLWCPRPGCGALTGVEVASYYSATTASPSRTDQDQDDRAVLDAIRDAAPWLERCRTTLIAWRIRRQLRRQQEGRPIAC